MKHPLTCLAILIPTLAAGVQHVGAAEGYAVRLDGASLWIEEDGKPVLTYRYRGVPFKPYAGELWFGGVNVLRDAPEDHLHHHGLMFAVSVDGVSFWGELEGNGSQIHQSFESIHASAPGEPVAAGFTERLEWRFPDGSAALLEDRTVNARPVYLDEGQPVYAVLVDWTSSLTGPEPANPDAAPVEIGGEHYYGLGLRMPRWMDEVGTFRNAAGAEGRVFRGEERLLEAGWCAYSVTQGRDITVAMFDHPGNPRGAVWFTMPTPFAYLSATLLYHEKPLTIGAFESLTVRYAAAVMRGTVTDEQISRVRNHWLGE